MFSDLKFRLRALFGRRAMERELDDELRFHLEHEIGKLVATGLAPDEAVRRARLAFGGIDRVKDEARDARGVQIIETLQQDLHYAWRGIVSKPGFAAAIIVALALGIGANTAMFGIVDRLLFRAPAYLADADRVHRIFLTSTYNGAPVTGGTVEYTRYADLTRWTTSFDRTAVFGYRTSAVGIGDDAREMTVAVVSASIFDFFDVRPAVGRFFTAAEDHTPVGEPVAVLGYGYWQSHFGGHDDAVGSQIHIGNLILTIIGVAPKGFVGVTDGNAPIAFIPVTTVAFARYKDYYTAYNWQWLEMIAHRKAGVTVATANADLTTAFRRSWAAQRVIDHDPTPIDIARPRGEAASIHSSRGPQASADSKVATWVMGVALIVLLVACANVANLLLARAVTRRREVALRVALGVSRLRLVQQLATESLVLAALGGVAALLVATWGGRALRATFIRDADARTVVTDARTLAFVAVLSLGVALLTGLAPIFHALRGDVNASLKAGSRDSAYRRSNLATALLIFQGALSVVLLVGAGLFAHSLLNVRGTRLGYDIDPLALVEWNTRGITLSGAEQSALNQRLLETAQATPGVVAATLVASIPFYGSESQGPPLVPGKDSLQRYGRFTSQVGSPSYFETVGTRILRGRGILATDGEHTAPVAVISQSMARAVWPGEDALGKQFRLGSDTTPFITVVGIAENVRAQNIRKSDEIWYYLPVTQHDRHRPDLFVRWTGSAEDGIATLRRRLQPLMPGASYVNVTPFSEIIGAQQKSWQFGALMFVAFGGLALLLAAIGLYSVIAYAVAQRTRELGVRIALGASSGTVIRMIVGQGVAFALAGIVVGSLIALAAGRWVEPLLFAQSAKDPTVFIAVGAVLLAVAVIASVRPAIRAMRVDPSEVLRTD